ncbi:MAG TPA: NAD-dependent epimerase/dehydratase family protein [Sphingomonadales bacterium]
MTEKVLITGGAGFIGSHVADALLAAGHEVRILDNLAEQVHGPGARRPAYLASDPELVVGDLRDPDAVRAALRGVDSVIHLAAVVGVGQSMYDVARYVAVNEGGTAVLMEALAARPVRRLVVASSMSIYGEGAARDMDGNLVEPEERTPDQLRRGIWDCLDHKGRPLEPVPTAEHKRPALSSVYALNKYAQERMCLMLGRAYGIETTALRFFNVYGPRQALSNPYTGLLAIFAARLLNGNPPLIFEDGEQRRDFVHVRDVAKACVLALHAPQAAGEVFNVGSGESRSVNEVATAIARAMNRNDIAPLVTRKYRTGDIRNCFADIAKAERMLGFRPTVTFDDGLAELAEYLGTQQAEDRVEETAAELESRGLVA